MSTTTNTNRVRDLQSRKVARASGSLKATYDAAQTTTDNSRLWAPADGLSAEAANSLAVRSVLRRRSRHEVANNSQLDGILDTLADDVVGTGPVLQMLASNNDDLNAFIQTEFAEWADAVGLPENLHVMERSGVETGEVFNVFQTNPGLPTQVKLDLELIEADQVTDPTWQSVSTPLWCDGIHYDAYGNPTSYRILYQHPGSNWTFSGATGWDYRDVSARFVYHHFRWKRPGQRRGVPEITSSLTNWPELRRYCNAVLAAADTAAEIAAVFKTTAPQDDGNSSPQVNGNSTVDRPDAFDLLDLPKRGAMILPEGVDLSQLKAEQPTTTYNGFAQQKLAEACRCISMPLTIAALDSANANMSARYQDGMIYEKTIRRRRKLLDRMLNQLFDLWLTEALLIPGYLPDAAYDLAAFPHKWFWPKIQKHADPDKIESARIQRLNMGFSSLAGELAEEGYDYREVMALAALSYGVTVPEYQALLRLKAFGAETATPVPADSPLLASNSADVVEAEEEEDVGDVTEPDSDSPAQAEAAPVVPRGLWARLRAALNR